MKHEKKHGLIAQVYILVVFGIIIVGAVTYITQFFLQTDRIKSQTGIRAAESVGELIASVKEYPAYRWLLSYWSEHAAEMEVEYDVDFSSGDLTKEKCELLSERHPGLNLRYCDESDVEALSDEDQKLYAEIVYSWLITRIEAIKRISSCDYLYCVMTDTEEGAHPYETEIFLLSGASPGEVRGTAYEEVYTLGVTSSIADKKNTRKAMRAAVSEARNNEGKESTKIKGEGITSAGNYVDYFSCLELMGGKAVLAGATYNVKGLLSEINSLIVKDSLVAMVYQFLLLQLILFHLFFYVLNPLKEILLNIRSYAETKDSSAAEANISEILTGRKSFAIRRNEIGQLAEDFVDLTKEIDAYTKQIETETAVRKRMEYELETAAGIQAHMLPEASPDFPGHPEFELSASMTPAREVGGDFYDYFLLDDYHLVLVMADVSDKGVPAALFMAETKTLIKSRAQYDMEPGLILSYVNNQLRETNTAGFFVTVWMAVIDLRTGEGKAANAGHENPVLCRKGGAFELVIYKHNMAVGVMENIRYRQHDFKLNPGDRLFVYTDGVPEAINTAEEQFGNTRMLEALNRRQDMHPKELLSNVSSEIDAFVGEAPRFDDTTMMCLLYKGASEILNHDMNNDLK